MMSFNSLLAQASAATPAETSTIPGWLIVVGIFLGVGFIASICDGMKKPKEYDVDMKLGGKVRERRP